MWESFPAITAATIAFFALASLAFAQVAVRGQTVHTMAGQPINNGVVIIEGGKIAAVGPADQVTIPDGMKTLEAAVVTPGLIDVHNVVGLSGILNYKHDQEQLDRSSAIQPELRAIDAYNPRDPLVDWIRGFGVTTVHTGHAPGELISGQTMIVKTTGDTVAEALVQEPFAIAATLGRDARRDGGKSPGTRGKMMSMLRAEFIKAAEYKAKLAKAEPDKPPTRDLKLEALVRVLDGEVPLLVTCQKAQDIESAMRLADEFKFKLILDGAAESYLLTEKIKAAGVPVLVHPLLARASGELENMSFETPARLRDAGIPFAIQGGFEDYVPKVRVILFEAAIAAGNGLTFDQALASITIDAARILNISDRVGSIEVGKDGDLALYDADPFEYTSHCIGTIINGQIVSNEPN